MLNVSFSFVCHPSPCNGFIVQTYIYPEVCPISAWALRSAEEGLLPPGPTFPGEVGENAGDMVAPWLWNFLPRDAHLALSLLLAALSKDFINRIVQVGFLCSRSRLVCLFFS